MCTAISDGSIFGRTLDLEYSLNEDIITIKKGHKFDFLHLGNVISSQGIRGCGIIRNGTPLFYDAANDSGLAMAALNFPLSAKYRSVKNCKNAIASFEVIPAVLSVCDSLSSAKAYLSNLVISDDSFSDDLPATGLHWMISDKKSCAVLESLEDGIYIHENPFGILTNEPCFMFHRANAAQYLHLTSTPPNNTFCPDISFPYLSHGLGAIGLPGDNSSPSRFIRALYNLKNTIPEEDPGEKIKRFFHIAATISQPNGTSYTPDGKPIKTVYTVCYDLENGDMHLRKY